MAFDMEQFRLREENHPSPKPKKAGKRVECKRFIKGPIPVEWLVRAGELPGMYTLRVGLVIFYVQGMTGGRAVLLNRYQFDQFKIGKDSARRALQRLEQAGLIKLGKKGRKFEVHILPIEETDAE